MTSLPPTSCDQVWQTNSSNNNHCKNISLEYSLNDFPVNFYSEKEYGAVNAIRRLLSYDNHVKFKHTARRVHSITARRFTLTVRLHEEEPSVRSLWNGKGFPMPALCIQISNPPYVSRCILKAALSSPVYRKTIKAAIQDFPTYCETYT